MNTSDELLDAGAGGVTFFAEFPPLLDSAPDFHAEVRAPYDALRGIDFAAFRAEAERLAEVHARLRGGTERMQREFRSARSGWQGPAAEAADVAVGELLGEGGALLAELAEFAGAIAPVVDGIERAVRECARFVADFAGRRCAGCTPAEAAAEVRKARGELEPGDLDGAGLAALGASELVEHAERYVLGRGSAAPLEGIAGAREVCEQVRRNVVGNAREWVDTAFAPELRAAFAEFERQVAATRAVVQAAYDQLLSVGPPPEGSCTAFRAPARAPDSSPDRAETAPTALSAATSLTDRVESPPPDRLTSGEVVVQPGPRAGSPSAPAASAEPGSSEVPPSNLLAAFPAGGESVPGRSSSPTEPACDGGSRPESSGGPVAGSEGGSSEASANDRFLSLSTEPTADDGDDAATASPERGASVGAGPDRALLTSDFRDSASESSRSELGERAGRVELSSVERPGEKSGVSLGSGEVAEGAVGHGAGASGRTGGFGGAGAGDVQRMLAGEVGPQGESAPVAPVAFGGTASASEAGAGEVCAAGGTESVSAPSSGADGLTGFGSAEVLAGARESDVDFGEVFGLVGEALRDAVVDVGEWFAGGAEKPDSVPFGGPLPQGGATGLGESGDVRTAGPRGATGIGSFEAPEDAVETAEPPRSAAQDGRSVPFPGTPDNGSP